MSFNPLAGDYAPQDPYRQYHQYHGQPEAEKQRQQYDYNPAQQDARFDPVAHAKQMARMQQDIHAGARLGEQRQQGGVTREMQELEKNLSILSSTIDALDNRLAAACIPAPEMTSGLRGTEGGGCSLANQLAAFNNMLSYQTTRIEMLYQGIDL